MKTTCQHKRANHQHGTRACYVLDKCRCPECTEASREYEHNRSRAHLYGRYDALVDATPVREHLEFLRTNGISAKQAAKLSGVPQSSINRIIHGRTERGEGPAKRISKENAAKILAVQPGFWNLADGHTVDGTGTHRRLQALVALGYSLAYLGRELETNNGNMLTLLERGQVTAQTARKVHALYNRLWSHPNTATNWQNKGAATRARNYAAARGWVSPLAWDDDTIDDPTAQPATTGMEATEGKRQTDIAARIENIEFLLNNGVTPYEVTERLGYKTPLTVARSMDRYHRRDLATIFEKAHRAGYRKVVNQYGVIK